MVRTISGTLTTAIGAKARIPQVTLTAQDQVMHLQNAVATAGNSENWTSSCIANDGSIIRVQVTTDPGGIAIFTQNFQWQRITDVTNATQWQTWTTFTGGSGNIGQDQTCAVSNNSGTINAFCQRGTGGNNIWVWSSSNNGVSWSGSPTSVLSPPGNALIKGLASAGNNDIFFIYDVVGGEAIGCSLFSAGAWSALHTWTLTTITSLANSSGIAVVWTGSYYVAYSDFFAIHLCTCSSNGVTWTALADIAQAEATAIQRTGLQIAKFDGVYWLTCLESDASTYTGTLYCYPRTRGSIDLIHWSNGFIQYDLNDTATTVYARGTTTLQKTQAPSNSRQIYIMAGMSKGVLYSNAYLQSDATQYHDFSGKVVEYKRTDDLGKPGAIAVVLDNANSAITSLVSSYGSTYEPLGLMNKLVLSEGYKTGTPPTTQEVVNTGTYRIRSIIFERAPGINHITIEAEDLSHLLDQKSRYQMTYINQTVSYMIKEICARAGLLNISVPSTSQMSVNIIAYILHASQTYRQALDELCRVGWLEYFMDETETMIFKELSSGDSSVWSYTPEIEMFVLASDDVRANHIVVTGLPPTGTFINSVTNGEAYDTTHMHVTGVERVEVEADPKLITTTLCNNKAAFDMAQEVRDLYAHSITVPCNPALQLVDVVTVTDQAATIGTGQSAVARIFKDEVHYLPEKGMFDQTIHLEGV